MRMGFIGLSTLFAAAALYFAATSRALSIPDSHHYVRFYAKGTPHFIKIKGEAENDFCTGVVNNGKGKVECRLNALKTGIGLRDKHMLKYLDAETYPKVSLEFMAEGEKFRGILKLKGIKKEIAGEYQASPLELRFTLNIEDFNIEPPSYLGIGIKPEVRIVAGLE